MKKFKNSPLIGITSNILTISEGPFIGQGRLFVNQGYVDAVAKAGGIPVILPIVSDNDVIQEQLSHLDGLIMSGGHDVHPSLYDEEPHQLLGETSSARDTYEFSLLKIADELEIPVLGICRGMQVMNVYFGGTLIQDLTLTNEELVSAHVGQFNLELHEVKLTNELSSIFNASTINVNSYHHQAIKDAAPGWIVSAVSSDGMIEAIENPHKTWQKGVQWHPEVQYAEMEPLFKALIESARSS